VSLVRVGFIPIPAGAAEGFDHADVYSRGRRMYVAHTGADRVDILDCAQRTFLRSLEGLPGVAGVLIDEDHDLLFTSDRASARVSVFRCSDEQLQGNVDVGPHPNGLAYDRSRRHLYSFNLGEPIGEHCSASVIDLGSLEVMGEVPLPGRTRWALYDPDRDLVYVNIRHPAQIAVIDARRIALDDAFAVPCEGPHGLWLDAGRLFCACDGGELIVLDDNRNIIASLPLPGTPDVVMLDPKVERVYVAVGDPGVVCSFDTRRLEQIETVETELGAHTAAWDPVDRSLYVFCPRTSGAIIYAER
jgi:DNA-binding beta-propeller fold protein YncE